MTFELVVGTMIVCMCGLFSIAIFLTNFLLNGGNKVKRQTARMTTICCLFGIDLIFHDQSSRTLLE